MSDEQIRIKLRKEALEAALVQIEYLRGIKKDALMELCKGLDGKVTQDDVEEIENLFRSLDVEEKNEVPFLQLGTMLRIIRQVPTDDEVNELIEVVNPDRKLNMDFLQFIKIVAANMRDPDDIADEIKKAFRILDRNKKGYLVISELRDFLTNIGNCLNDEEVDEMIKIADYDQSGQINYEKFVETMLLMKTEKKKKKKGKKVKKKK